jgi:predicted transcriptional regulator
MINTIELRSDIHHLIDKVNDVDILQAVKIILAKETKSRPDWADTLSNTLKVELEESILEADQGKTISHDEAMKQIKNRYHL